MLTDWLRRLVGYFWSMPPYTAICIIDHPIERWNSPNCSMHTNKPSIRIPCSENGRKRERERERERERRGRGEREGWRQRQRQRQRQTDRQTERDRERQRETERGRERNRKRMIETERQRDSKYKNAYQKSIYERKFDYRIIPFAHPIYIYFSSPPRSVSLTLLLVLSCAMIILLLCLGTCLLLFVGAANKNG